MGVSYALRKRQQQGGAVDGQFSRAQKYTSDYHQYTLSLQNPDGSFSTEWFTGRGNRLDKARRLQTTGHILEWMAYSMSPEMLEDPRMVKAADYLSGLLLDGQSNAWEIGPLGHALHALALYDERVFKGREGAAKETSPNVPRVKTNSLPPHRLRPRTKTIRIEACSHSARRFISADGFAVGTCVPELTSHQSALFLFVCGCPIRAKGVHFPAVGFRQLLSLWNFRRR